LLSKMKNGEKQLAKIYYQDREVKNIDILFEDLDYKISIVKLVNIKGDDPVTGLQYERIENESSVITDWYVKDHLDKVKINHIDSGVMINWVCGMTDDIKRSLFIPMTIICHITTNDPIHDDDGDEKPKEVIDK